MSSRNPRTARVCCPSHPDADLVEDYRAGDLVCPECGLVVGDRVVDVGTEWRTFSNESSGDDPSRVGGPENPLLSGQDLSTMIGAATGPAGLDASGFAKYKGKKTISSADRALLTAFREISSMSDRINLPRSVVDRADLLFKQVYESKQLRGRNTDAIAAACLYIACRKEGVPRTFKEICAISRVAKREIGRCFKLILKTLDTNVNLIQSGEYMARFCGKLELVQAITKAATYVAKKAKDLDILPGRSPISVAAAAIFLACVVSKDPKTAKEIADVSGVAESTIKQTYKNMVPHAIKLFPEDFEPKVPYDLLKLSV